MWTAIVVGALCVYLVRLAGLSVPSAVLENERVQSVAALLPVALLASLVVLQTFATGTQLTVDARAAGLAVALVAVLLRAPFLLVVLLAAVTTALLRSVM
jgi:uncharacterized membrane protein